MSYSPLCRQLLIINLKAYVPDTPKLPYCLEHDVIIKDIGVERPTWILSCYGPGKDAPRQLFGGLPREQSFEELRLRHYVLAAAGNQQQSIQEAEALVRSAEQQMERALKDVDGALNYIISGENQHPNRRDVCASKGAGNLQPQPSRFSQQALSPVGAQSTAFGKPSTLAGNSTFGQPTALTGVSAFGKPSALGAPSVSFGTPAFGQPATLTQLKPSVFGQPTTTTAQQSVFGQPSKPSDFGQISNPSTFGLPSNQSKFGQPSNTSTFDQPSNPLTLGQPTNPFARHINQAAPASGPGFPNPIVTISSNSFNTQQGSSSFGRPGNAPSNPFAKPNPSLAPSSFVRGTRNADPAPSNYSQASEPNSIRKDISGRLTEFKGRPISYIDGQPCTRRSDGLWERIWFPDGPPKWKKAPDLSDDAYDEKTVAQYKYWKETGTFKDGIMPELPPKREWCSWDF